jgi:hypothetical protein
MSVNLEIKGMLAKLLATEDLIVEHKKVETACFNVHTRVLTLPFWEKASDAVYTMLVAHECGHAIFTDDTDWSNEYKIPKQFVNIVEDVRIEKLMKRKYAGLAKSFFNGYRELSIEDFFQLGDEDVNEMNLADRVNLYYKIGNFISVDFTEQEKEIVDLIGSVETFDDALKAAEVLYNYCKQENEEQESIPDLDIDANQSSGSQNDTPSDLSDQTQGENQSEPTPDTSDKDQDGEKSQSNDSKNDFNNTQEKSVDNPKPSNKGGKTSEPKVNTMDKLEKSLKDLVNLDSVDNVYVEIPKLDIDNLIISNSELHNVCEEYWGNNVEAFITADKEFREFKNSTQKEVNYLVKEFECRKAADSYARATTARTGVLDCTKLHTYKYNDDLFRKVTTLADGKNHGLVFILDWSGSMSRVMLDTIKQLFNLIWFCKKLNIPFDVYAFTYDYPVSKREENGTVIYRKPSYKKDDGILCIDDSFSLLNMLTSKVSNRTLEKQMLNIYRIARYFGDRNYSPYSIPIGWTLSGTPLNETLVALHEILPIFQRNNKAQKVQCVILTDGDAPHLKYHKQFNNRTYGGDSIPYLGIGSLGQNSYLRDRKTGYTYSLNCGYKDFSNLLLRNLRDKFPSVNFIGMRIIESHDCSNFIRHYTGYNYDSDYGKIMSQWKKEKSFSIKNSGYHTYFGISASSLSSIAEFQVIEDATKSQIKNAFMKSLKSKKMNKKVLNEFIDLIV